MNWYVVTTKPQCEKLACADLVSEGMMVYMPMARVEVFDRRARNVTIRKLALFNRYVFVGMRSEKDLGSLHVSKHITGILGNDDKPYRIPEIEIEAMGEAQERGVFDRKLSNNNKAFKAGERVLIERGALTGFYGTVVSAEGKKMVSLLTDMFGMLSDIKISVDDLKKVA